MRAVFLLGLLPLIGLFKEVKTQTTQPSNGSILIPDLPPVSAAPIPTPVKAQPQTSPSTSQSTELNPSPSTARTTQDSSTVSLSSTPAATTPTGSISTPAQPPMSAAPITAPPQASPSTSQSTEHNPSPSTATRTTQESSTVLLSAMPAATILPANVTAPPKTSPTSQSTELDPSASTANITTRNSSAASSTPAATVPPPFSGNCSSPTPLCCLGTNNSCFRTSCYCDEICVSIGDCCSDYNQTCSSLQPSRVIMKVRGNLTTNRGEAAFRELDFLVANRLRELCSNCAVEILNRTIMKDP
ncbi:uncharacterized protein LOC134067286 [Sardina pilchardus]|uniref:uncharacterized protein LOC134067286 n=1 Tax=Sardina pilchardus TaxID=27697 RepID=UPI002E0DCCF0